MGRMGRMGRIEKVIEKKGFEKKKQWNIFCQKEYGVKPFREIIIFENTKYSALIEKDDDGYFVAEVPALKSCYTQARTLEELYPRIWEVIELCREVEVPANSKGYI